MPDRDAKPRPTPPQVDSVPQGEAVDAALRAKPNRDLDRWGDFSKSDAAKLADDPAAPAEAQIPLAGLPRKAPDQSA